MKIKDGAELIRIMDKLVHSCYGCQYFGREYENNDIRCNCRKSEFYLDVPPGEPCNHWRPKE